MKNLKLISIFIFAFAQIVSVSRALATTERSPPGKSAEPSGEVFAKEVNEKAERFVSNANNWMIRRSELDSEMTRGIKALANACTTKQADHSIAEVQRNSLPDLQHNLISTAEIKFYEAEIASVKTRLSDRIKLICGTSMRASGMRNERCLILEMGEQWANQTEQFIKQHRVSSDQEGSLLAQMSELGRKACLSEEHTKDMYQKMLNIIRHLHQGFEALIKDALRQLSSIASDTRR
ncbi:MAG: hypothetical protein EB069_06750 [Actinobacteria bacterium]|nr:hypothetical protein [Actinomycetota bacterium]